MSTAELNETRLRLPSRIEDDFTDRIPSIRDFEPWGGLKFVPPGQKGMRIVAPGSELWTAVGTSYRRRLKGDFDVVLELTLEKLAIPRDGDNSAVTLQTEFDDEDRTAIEIKYGLMADGITAFRTLSRTQGASGTTIFRNQESRPTASVDALRIARRGPFVWLVFRETSDSDWRILTARVGEADITPKFLRMHLHTGGENRESSIWLRKLSIAEQTLTMPVEQ